MFWGDVLEKNQFEPLHFGSRLNNPWVNYKMYNCISIVGFEEFLFHKLDKKANKPDKTYLCA